jgi:hypothetical protein
MRRSILALVVIAVGSLSGCGTAEPVAAAAVPASPVRAPAPVSGNATVELTFYGAVDNDPPGSTEIAYPNSRHPGAGGTGSYADPLTLATDPRELPPGSTVYVPFLKKYFVMEDDCAECIQDWSASKKPHLDLWMSATGGADLLRCEDALTPDDPAPVRVNPPADLPVDPRALFAGGHCLDIAPPPGRTTPG